MKFEITYIFDKRRPVMVFARKMEPGAFTLSETPKLGGVPIKPHVSQPRALTPDGRPDLTQFAFMLATASDLTNLSKGQVVELT